MKNGIIIKARVSETVHHFFTHGHTLENVHPFIFSTADDRAFSKTSESKFVDILACSSKAMKETLNECATDRLKKIY
jgi:hypothetical protein